VVPNIIFFRLAEVLRWIGNVGPETDWQCWFLGWVFANDDSFQMPFDSFGSALCVAFEHRTSSTGSAKNAI